MRACHYETTGPAREVPRIGRLPDPRSGPGEVRVRPHWSGVNASDAKARAGSGGRKPAFPLVVPCSDGACVIDRVGEGVEALRLAKRAWVWNGAWQRAMGTSAQHVVQPQAQAVRHTNRISPDTGACPDIPTLTALHAVRCVGGVEGKRARVSGGARAVGHCVVQMARRLGPKQVLARLSREAKARLVEPAGANAAITYRTQDVATAVRALTAGALVDRVIEVDVATIGPAIAEWLRPGGDAIVYSSSAEELRMPSYTCIARNVSLHFFIVCALSPDDRQAAIRALGEMLKAGALEHRIAARMPMTAIAQAYELVESGRAVRNVVVEID